MKVRRFGFILVLLVLFMPCVIWTPGAASEQDCSPEDYCCGNGICDPGEDNANCPEDCTLRPDDSLVMFADLPASLACGETYHATIVMRNAGTNTWRPETGYKLGAVDNDDPLSSELRIELPPGTEVAPQQEHSFSLTLVAPSVPGNYLTDWRMLREGVAWFGQTASQTVSVTCQPEVTDNAELVFANLPTLLECGETSYPSVTMRNSATSTWTASAGYRLGAVDDYDPFTAAIRVDLPSGVEVRPGQEHSFPLTLVAPSVSGSYLTDWRMLREGVAWFGQTASRNVVVACQPGTHDDAEVVSVDLPTTLACGATYAASITLRNTGTSTWVTYSDPDGRPQIWGHQLGAVGNSDPFAEQLRISILPFDSQVLPRGVYTFPILLTAPTTPGSYVTDWRMFYKDQNRNLHWFGPTVAGEIEVSCVADDARVIRADIPTSLACGERYDATVIMRNTGSATWTEADGYALVALGGSDPFVEVGRVELLPAGTKVIPGQEHRFEMTLVAPDNPGTYLTDWRMVHGEAEFGETLSKDVDVACGCPGCPPVGSREPFGVVAAEGMVHDQCRLDDIAELGVGWVRASFPWHLIEVNHKGDFHWEEAEGLVNEILSRRMHVYWDLSYAPCWANGRPCLPDGGTRPEDTSYPPLNQEDLYEYVYAVVSRFKDRVHYWGTWNEPNDKKYYKNGVSEYIQKELQTTIRAVRDADPTARIVVGELTNIGAALEETKGEPLLRRMLDSVRGRFDVISQHVYDGDDEEDPCGYRRQRMDLLRRGLEGWGYGDYPVWVTETGLNRKSENLRSDYLRCFYDEMWFRPWWARTFWYRYEDDSNVPDGGYWGLSTLVNGPNSCQPHVPFYYIPNTTYDTYRQYIRTHGK